LPRKIAAGLPQDSIFCPIILQHIHKWFPHSTWNLSCSVCRRYLYIRNRETWASCFQQTPMWSHCCGVTVSVLEHYNQWREDSGSLLL
jgi:hypothetical protein